MAIYTAQIMPPQKLKNLLEDFWSTLEGHVPIPNIVVINSDEELRQLIGRKDLLAIRTDSGGEKETLRNAWAYKDVRWDVLIEIWTMENRQRLYDILLVIRGICHSKVHSSSETGFQVLKYVGFVELTTDLKNVWVGNIRVSLESSGVALDTI